MDDAHAGTDATVTQTAAGAFLEQYARTRHFLLGAPRLLGLSPDGTRLAFLRSESGSSPVQSLYVLEVESGEERLVADPRALCDDDGLSRACEEELARRERVREHATGIVAADLAWEAGLAAFVVDDRLFVAELSGSGTRAVEVDGPVYDPRLSPDGRLLAFVSSGSLRLVETGRGRGAPPRTLLASGGPHRSFGVAEFLAAEEMGRTRGFWWSPAGDMLLVTGVDNEGVPCHHLGDARRPEQRPRAVHYPFAGTRNATVTLQLVGLDGSTRAVEWDHEGYEYLVAAVWDTSGLLVYVESRDQRRAEVLEVDPASGASVVREHVAVEPWIHLTPGVPALTASGALVTTVERDGSRRLALDGTAVTPPGLEVREVLGVEGERVLVRASRVATEIEVWEWSPSGLECLTPDPGVHEAMRRGGTTVVVRRSLKRPGSRTTVSRGDVTREVTSLAEQPLVVPRVEFSRLGPDELAVAVLRPDGPPPEHGYPVLLDPYGGPASQRVLASLDHFLLPAFWAAEGFVVVVADGHGTPGRGPAWERSIRGDLVTLPLADQVAALHAVAARDGDLDLSRVAMRGWSFGGFLSAAAVLRRPEVFAAAVDGAGDVDARLYDTHYKERYLGHPDEEPESYDRCSLVREAAALTRPLLVMHGMADDNVLLAHSIRFVDELVRHARPHAVALLPGVTHQVPEPEATRGRLVLELDFLRRALGMA